MNLVSNDVSKDFPIHDKIYLNNASASLTPFSTIQAMNDFLVTYSSIGPDSQDSDIFIKEKINATRKTVSKLIKCRPEEVIFTQSTTDGVNIVSNGMSVVPGSNIIIRGMEHEHHANYYPWLKLSQKIELRSLKIDKDGFFDFNELKDFVDVQTRLVSLSHALYNTGAILPVEKVGKFLEEKNIPYFLDTAQTVGCIGNYNFTKTKCDFMAFTGSKWLCGPMGIGIFYCKKDSSDLLIPPAIGGESAMLYDKTSLAFKDTPEKFQTGFRNYVGMVGLDASINFLNQYGLENIRHKIMKLSSLLRDELTKISGITIFGPPEEEKRTSIISFTKDGSTPQTIVQKLEKKKIILAVREIFETKIVRASPHFFNTEEEILRVIEEIKRL
jgi:cysteine desulfurase/selenocysteine lyase